ncbi:MAG: T9SS type A sorting domain-containing protein [candidate division WOR-3 bacterium]
MKKLFLLSLILFLPLHSYTIGQKKSQIFLRWGITLAFYPQDIIARVIDKVQYEEGGTLKDLNFVVWTPYEKIPVKRFKINKISGNLPQRKYGWLIASGIGIYRTSSLDNTNLLAFSKIIPGKIIDFDVSYKKSGSVYIPQNVFAVDSMGNILLYNSTTFTVSVIDTNLNPLSISLVTGKIDTIIYAGRSDGVYFAKINDNYQTWTKVGNLSERVDILYATSSFILAATPSGLFRWDGTNWTQINNLTINSIKGTGLPNSRIYMGTTSGAYYSDDNGLTWVSINAFSGKDVISLTEKTSGSYPGLGTFFAVIRNEGVYDDLGNHFTSGLNAFLNYGALNGFDVESDNYNRIWYACEAGLFYLKDLGGGNYGWNFNPGIEEQYDPQKPETSTMIGINVADEIVNAFLSAFKPLFSDTLYIDLEKIKSIFLNYFGSSYPEDTFHFVINPYLVTPPDPDGSPPYKPSDIMPVSLFTLHDKWQDNSQGLKDAIYVKVGFELLGKVGGFLSLTDLEKKFVFDYQFVNRGLFNLKPKENKLVRKGFATLLIGNYKYEVDQAPITGIPGIFDFTEYYDSTGTNVDMNNISKYHGEGEPEANEYSTARIFTLLEYIKEKYGISKIKELFSDTSTSLERFKPYISQWAIANAKKDYTLFVPFPKEESTTELRYAFIEQEPFSYVIYNHNPDASTHILRFSFPDDASYFDAQGNWFSPIEVWNINYKVDNTIEVTKLFPDNTLRHTYFVLLNDNTVSLKQQIVVVNTDLERVFSTARGRDLEVPYPILMVFQNPAIDNFVDVYLWSRRKVYKDVNEEGVELTISEGGRVIDVDENLTNLAGSAPIALFTTSKELQRKSAIYNFNAYVEDTTGNGTNIVVSVPVFYVTGGGIFASSDGSIKVNIPSNINNSFMLTLSRNDKIAFDYIIPGSAEGYSDIITIGRNGKVISSNFRVEIIDPSLKNEGVTLYRYESGIGWIPVEGIVDRNEGKFLFETNTFGVFQVRSGGGGLNTPLIKAPPIMKKEEAKISFYIPVKKNVELSIYNSSGRKISKLLKGEKEPGIYEFTLNIPSQGTYFIVADIEGFSTIKKKVIVFDSK